MRKLLVASSIGLGILGVFLFEFCSRAEIAMVAGFLGLWIAFPAEERWAPEFPPEFLTEFEDGGGAIEFEGIVSKRGFFGHKGIMQRKVQITRVIQYHPKRS